MGDIRTVGEVYRGLSGMDKDVYDRMFEDGCPSMREMARQLGVSLGCVYGHVMHLRQAGLVERVGGYGAKARLRLVGGRIVVDPFASARPNGNREKRGHDGDARGN